MKLYAARDKNTGKLVSDITNPRRKFWQRRRDCVNAINSKSYYRQKDYDLELVVFELIEVEDDENENNQ